MAETPPSHPEEPTAPVPVVGPGAGQEAETSPHAVDGPDATLAAGSGGGGGWRGRLRGAWPWLRWPVLGAVVLLVALVGLASWIWATTELPPARSIGESAVLLDRNGEELAVLAQEGLRLEVPLEDMAPVAVDALIAAEDQRFFEHTGVDPLGIGRALWNNLRSDSTQGGSTITQQLVKNAYLTSDRTLTRKVREAVLAVKLERNDDKEAILERYLNTVYFGRGAYGIEAAARTYFDASSADLTAEQAALLVGMLRAPHQLDPAVNPDAALERRNAVLGAMVDTEALTAEEAEAAIGVPIQVSQAEVSPTQLRAGVAPHFVEHVRAQLIEQFGEQALYDEGLVVRTTLDIADQRAAEAAVAAHLDDPADPQAAVVGIDREGAVRAWVGGRDFEALQVDLVSAGGGSGRQPGSTFKALALAATFERGNGAGQRFPAPAEITLDIEGEPWTVSNAGGGDRGVLTLAEATAQSVNTVYAQVVAQIGAEPIVDVARRLGIQRELSAEPSIVLGTEEVSPLELATAFSTLSRSGSRVDPYLYTSVETRDGEVRWELGDVEQEQAVEPRIADTVSAVLGETPRSGTARRAALDRPMAAKTGTTQGNADAWLAGYTPEYTAIVWVGNPDSNQPMPPVDGETVQGGSVPAEIWHDFMVEALADVPPTPFPEPDPELLRDTAPPLDLTATPSVEAGGVVEVRGNGYQLCRGGWWAVLEGPSQGNPQDSREPQPVFVESAPEVGSDEPERRAELRMPVTAVAGTYQVTARCDSGSGAQPLGPAVAVEVPLDPDNTTTTTTTSSTTTTTEPGRGRDEPDETTTTTTSSTTTSTTTTTAPRGGGGGGGDG
ncbi:MAG TPA: transglycosylase domain-containing protein [Acidimicrobiales bacterium]|nr:transglycosylase domain-containing protein [Acidimicrobiales bacterium]